MESGKWKVESMDWWKFEKEAKNEGFNIICGVDEAGRGPLCGDVYAAAVILPFEMQIDGLNDSKKLSEKKREQLYEIIIQEAISYGIGYATPAEIDEINILNASFVAMKRAIDNLKTKPDLALIDGNRIKGLDIQAKCIIKGDSLSASIAAASIIAKVSRDRVMRQLHIKYPQYNLAQHKGYPTKAHYEAIKQFGINEIYRKSFLKGIDI